MTKSREIQVDVSSTPYYHVYSRCVRQAYLFDSDLGIDHKQLFIERLKTLTSVFCIDIAAYAVMSNHYHLVVHIDSERLARLDEREVASRWFRLFKNTLAESWLNYVELSESEKLHLDASLVEWRQRLGDLSWFMRCLNEYIAREVNKLEKTKGRFWESRFKSKALLDEAALLTCMQYVDLDPIRADSPINTLEHSDYTAIQDRIIAYQLENKNKLSRKLKARANTVQLDDDGEVKGLMPFAKPPLKFSERELLFSKKAPIDTADTMAEPSTACIPFYRDDYFELIEWTGKALLPNKAGSIPNQLIPILERLNLNAAHWLDTISEFDKHFIQVVGQESEIRRYCKKLTQDSKRKHGLLHDTFSWFKGIAQSRKMYRTA